MPGGAVAWIHGTERYSGHWEFNEEDVEDAIEDGEQVIRTSECDEWIHGITGHASLADSCGCRRTSKSWQAVARAPRQRQGCQRSVHGVRQGPASGRRTGPHRELVLTVGTGQRIGQLAPRGYGCGALNLSRLSRYAAVAVLDPAPSPTNHLRNAVTSDPRRLHGAVLAALMTALALPHGRRVTDSQPSNLGEVPLFSDSSGVPGNMEPVGLSQSPTAPRATAAVRLPSWP